VIGGAIGGANFTVRGGGYSPNLEPPLDHDEVAVVVSLRKFHLLTFFDFSLCIPKNCLRNYEIPKKYSKHNFVTISNLLPSPIC